MKTARQFSSFIILIIVALSVLSSTAHAAQPANANLITPKSELEYFNDANDLIIVLDQQQTISASQWFPESHPNALHGPRDFIAKPLHEVITKVPIASDIAEADNCLALDKGPVFEDSMLTHGWPLHYPGPYLPCQLIR